MIPSRHDIETAAEAAIDARAALARAASLAVSTDPTDRDEHAQLADDADHLTAALADLVGVDRDTIAALIDRAADADGRLAHLADLIGESGPDGPDLARRVRRARAAADDADQARIDLVDIIRLHRHH